MLCVAPDKDWQDFASQSEHLAFVKDSKRPCHTSTMPTYQALAEEIVAAWRESKGGDFIEAVHRAFEYRLEDLNLHATGDADVDFETEPIVAVLQLVNH